jgi:hypothetical protein
MAGGAPGGEISASTTLDVTLVKIALPVFESAHPGYTVDIRWQREEYVVHLAGQYLGTIPVNYNESLSPPTPYQGSIVAMSALPLYSVTVRIRLA